MDRRAGIIAICACLLLSGCYCMHDPKDEGKGVMGYISGCWETAKGNE